MAEHERSLLRTGHISNKISGMALIELWKAFWAVWSSHVLFHFEYTKKYYKHIQNYFAFYSTDIIN